VNKIRLVTAGKTNGIFWDTLGQVLENEAGFVLLHCRSEQDLENELKEKPHALLLEQTPILTNDHYQHYYRLHPGLSIIAFDTHGEETILRIRDLGQELLVRLIHILASDNTKKPIHTAPHFHLIKSSQNKDSKEPVSVDNSYEKLSNHITDVQKWIDLKLFDRLAIEKDAQGVSTPGWAMNAERAISLLRGVNNDADTDARQSLEQHENYIKNREKVSLNAGFPSKLQIIASQFSLKQSEQQLLYFALAPELDSRYGQIFGFLNDDLTRRRPTASILAQLIYGHNASAWQIRQLMSDSVAFSKFRLLETEKIDSLPGADVGIAPCPELVTYLLGNTQDKTFYGSHLNCWSSTNIERICDSSDLELRGQLQSWGTGSQAIQPKSVIQLVGNQNIVSWFRRLWAKNSQTLVEFEIDRNNNISVLIEQCHSAARVAVLNKAPLIICGLTRLTDEQISLLPLARLSSLLPHLIIHTHRPFLVGGIDSIWHIERSVPSVKQRSQIWQSLARTRGLELNAKDSRRIAATLNYDETDIAATLSLCHKNKVLTGEILSAARRIARREIPNAVRRVEARFTWDDIVLPEEIIKQLMKIPFHVRHAGEVLEEWNYLSRVPYGHGVTALFSGASGTGKTMAAQIIAQDIGVELFQVDLSKLVSKYIGETEKNLESVFEAAEKACAVLLFDEADALFGKRTEIRDAHDRHANVEVAYLLQRMESFAGLAILTTNLRQNLDTAFMRRLRFVIDFPVPKALEREAIWHRVFPADAPLDKDLEFAFLARSLDLTGGNIQQIALRAAFAAVADTSSIGMQHVVQATREELQRLGMKSKEMLLSDQRNNGMSA